MQSFSSICSCLYAIVILFVIYFVFRITWIFITNDIVAASILHRDDILFQILLVPLNSKNRHLCRGGGGGGVGGQEKTYHNKFVEGRFFNFFPTVFWDPPKAFFTIPKKSPPIINYQLRFLPCLTNDLLIICQCHEARSVGNPLLIE